MGGGRGAGGEQAGSRRGAGGEQGEQAGSRRGAGREILVDLLGSVGRPGAQARALKICVFVSETPVTTRPGGVGQDSEPKPKSWSLNLRPLPVIC